MKAKSSTKLTPDAVMRQDVRERLASALSFQDMIGDGDINLDALAEYFLKADIKAGANVQRASESDYQKFMEALPEPLRNQFARYVDALGGQSMYYAEAGYAIGLEVARQARAITGDSEQ